MQPDISTLGATLSGEVGNVLSGRLCMVVMDHGCLSQCPLPTRGSLRIGRAETSEIVVNDRAASRFHAVLHVGNSLELVDLGSHNGTRLRNQPLVPRRPMSLAPGDAIQIGGATLVIHRSSGMGRVDSASGTRRSVGSPGQPVVAAPAMRAVFELVERVAKSNMNVLVLGETGAGKEVVAESIHRASGRRSQGPFVRINCAALCESLFESELFGHQQGSFTGAVRSKAGLMQTADKGTLFLDEIGELPLTTQAKLLRVIETRQMTPVGALKPVPLDVRFLCATNRDLQTEVKNGNFREDLFFRLNGLAITVPPLRERVCEIAVLAHSFLANIAAELERPVQGISSSVIEQLRRYSWPGNVRELRNVVEYAVLFANDSDIELEHLPTHVREASPLLAEPRANFNDCPTSVPLAVASGSGRVLAWNARRSAEVERIVQALGACNGNQTRAAEQLGMPRRTLVAKLAAYDLPRPRKINRSAER